MLCGLKIDTSDERDRQRLVGAQELCQRALLIAGSGSMFPACRIAGQLACQAYWDFCAHPSRLPTPAALPVVDAAYGALGSPGFLMPNFSA